MKDEVASAATGSGKSFWETHAANYDRSLSLLGRPMPRMLDLVKEAVRGAGRVLEVAAGTGLVTIAMASEVQELVATDYALSMVQRLQGRLREAGLGNVVTEEADIYALKFPDACFDAVVAANVLHLVPHLDGALAALRRVLKPGGILIAPTFCHDETKLAGLVSRALGLAGFPGHRRFTAASLTAALREHHVTVTRAETIPGVIPIGYVQGVFHERSPRIL